MVLKLIMALLSSIKTQSAIDEAYLAGSVDIYDLERRMREIDQRSRNGSDDVFNQAAMRLNTCRR